MSDLSSKTFGVFDHYGLFTALARRLAQSGAKVFYATPVDRRDRITDAIVGDGMPDIVCVDELWTEKAKIDCFVFPDIRHSGLQAELRSQGLPVWGSQGGMQLEQNRQFFMAKLAELGLDVPDFDEIQGVTNLGLFLKDKSDIWIKVSKWRGTWETFHWRGWEQDWHNLDQWACLFGGIKEFVRFLCFPKIETDLEIGADTYCVDGQWPSLMLHGIERKDQAYFAAVTKREDMPEQLIPVMDALSPFLQEVGYRNQWSMENRVTKDKNYFIDATTRGGLPSTASFLKAKNTPEVIYHGAHGDFVELDYGFRFSAECMVTLKGDAKEWQTCELTPEVKESFLAQQACEVKGQLWYPPTDDSSNIGWLLATGQTPKECLEQMNHLADELPDGANAEVEALADVIREINSEQDQGIRFTDVVLPDADIVLEES